MTSSDLRGELIAALEGGAPHGDLLAIVLHHKERGVSQRETYDTLHRIWMELGCQDYEDDLRCVTLEDVMDRVLGSCAARDLIWDSSLSDAPRE